ncbi:MAG: zinc-binding alcohol dehydrogenase [Abditibacteriales bacterium]|nr:zinc-binding alcohol dehydrogenase [Abditibacteriales bacterium]MDW8365037.1 zinc-binding alcohol dehydrogenase [Abditibacteriales bacterium]
MVTHTLTVSCEAPKQVVVKEEPLPALGAGMLLVRGRFSAISTGTELTHVMADFPPESVWARITRYPQKLGYSHVGEVVATGEGVDKVQVGDRVVGGKPHSQWVVYRQAEPWVKVPEGVSDEAAALWALAIIALNGVRRAKVQLGEIAVVFGLGPIGIWAAQFARLAGARPVIGVDLVAQRRELAERSKAVDVALDGVDKNLPDKIAALTNGRMADVVFEVTGSAPAIAEEVKVVRKQGRLVILSSPRGKTEFDFHDWCNYMSLSIIGAHASSQPPHENPDDPWTRERNTELFFELVKRGEVVTTELVTHRIKGTEASKAYELLMTARGTTGIVLLDWR